MEEERSNSAQQMSKKEEEAADCDSFFGGGLQRATHYHLPRAPLSLVHKAVTDCVCVVAALQRRAAQLLSVSLALNKAAAHPSAVVVVVV